MRVAARLSGYTLVLAVVAAAGWVGGRTIGPVDANSPSQEAGGHQSSEHTTVGAPAPATDSAPSWAEPAPATMGQSATALAEAVPVPISAVPVMAAVAGPLPVESARADTTPDTRSADPRRLSGTGMPTTPGAMPAQLVTAADMPSGDAMGHRSAPDAAAAAGSGGDGDGTAHPVGDVVATASAGTDDDQPGPGRPGVPGGRAGQAGLPGGGGNAASKPQHGPSTAAGDHAADTHGAGDKHGGKGGR